MKAITVFSLGSLPAFDRTTADANYWQERYAYERSMMLYLLAEQTWTLSQVEQADINDAWVKLDDYLNNTETGLTPWIEDAVDKHENNLPVPAPPALPKNVELTGQLGLANILAQLDLTIELNLFRFGKTTSGGGGGDTELAQICRKALLKEIPNGSGDEFSLVELLQNTPIEILLTRYGEIADVKLE